MRTAGDVRNRILWDTALNKEHFTVGYMDRFLGMVELPFAEFSWGALCDAGPDDLSVPQHCIRYFRYKGHTVWDRRARVDHVFGSVGSGNTILDVVRELDVTSLDVVQQVRGT